MNLETETAANEPFLEQLHRYGRIVFSSVGDSMYPMLRDSNDVVVLVKPEGPFKRRDVALYRSDDGTYVLHRVLFVTPESVVFCGDNNLEPDPPVRTDRVIAVVQSFYRGKRQISVKNPLYKAYARLWCVSLKLRPRLLRGYRRGRALKARARRTLRWIQSGGQSAAANAMIRDIAVHNRARIALMILCRVFSVALYMAFVLVTRTLVDSAAAGDIPALVRASALLAALTAIRIGLNFLSKWLNRSAQRRELIRLRTRIYESILYKKQQALNEFHSTVLLERLTRDLDQVISYPIITLPSYIGSLTGLVCAVWAIFKINRLLPAMIIAFGLALCGVGRFFQKKAKDNFRVYSAANEQTKAYYQESMANSLMFKVFRAQRQAKARAEAYEKDIFGKWKRWFLFNQMLNTGVGAFFQLGYVGAMVFCAALIARNAMTFGGMTAILQLVDEIQDPFSSLGDLMSERYATQSAAERILEIENMPDEPMPALSDGWELYGHMEKLQISNLSFRYDRQMVLSGANAEMRKGDFVVISGPSGIGKSTLFQLLLGVYEEYTGEISLFLDDGERIPLSVETRALFSYVPQKHMMSSGTVRDNLCFLCGEAGEEEIWAAARLADAEGFLRELPMGLDTPLGEQGVGISEGQAQRLAIARALLRRAPILVLDEATSALDEDTERRVLHNICALKDITLLVISHRSAAYEICTREWRMSGGQIEGRMIAHER